MKEKDSQKQFRRLKMSELVANIRPLVKKVEQKNNFLLSQPKHVVGTQKNGLSETILLSTQNIC